MDNILNHIGKTPLVHLDNLSQELKINVYAKMESMNPGKSLKDRSSKNILLQALKRKLINTKTTVIESSSGNMAIGLARVCSLLGLKFIAVVDPNINSQTLKILQLYGAHIEMVSVTDGTGSYLNTRLKRVQTLLSSIPNSYTTNQYSNPDNPQAHRHIFKEIKADLGHSPDYLFTAVSTCGSVRGILDEIAVNQDKTKVIAVDAEGSLIFSDQVKTRYIPGMGASRKPDFDITQSLYAHQLVSEQETIAGCYQLLKLECILAGGSTGAQVAALMKRAPTLEPGADVCMIVADDGERYLDTIYDTEWVKRKIDKK
ncbi:2,3-diaminopropionate biosynthesis protein SbnA [Sphingobacterium sp. UT-1RO-CII-1]|uniref:2,3-diaminopropionate biosynthesis protein SbnA n=1 Tax=Sphingobacterium sp. UT-1RO-CII-1 TaxID=2995225 RepID=UPI00227CBB32|nr:2,3-diaminopropionate biosynthesis protein SbnA [Sphingobacterium sp. UT-1RO-CII-1]MCY4778889.1 2,3-diaminopropionate biosynthesis protein SbnA [Sphingobacterium sp. UT-1RO-CII-1]